MNSGKLKKNKKKQDTIHFENSIYRVIHEGSNITALFAEYLKFQEKMIFAHSFWVNSEKSKATQLKLEHYTFWNCYIKGAPLTEQYHSSFRGAPTISRINDFYRSILGGYWGIKIRKNRIWTLYILELLHTGCSTKDAMTLLLSRSN